MAKDIEETKILLDSYLNNTFKNLHNPLKEYSEIDFWTNENIRAYFNFVPFGEKDSALSVCAGGDHTFNLIEKGILNVDTFDTNRLAEYFALGLKRAMILKYTYEEYIEIDKLLFSFARGENFIFEKELEIIISLLPYMDSKYRKFWRELIDYNYKLQRDRAIKISLFRILTHLVPIYFENLHIDGNSFLCSEYAYNTLKENLSNANITFKYADALDLPKRFKGRKYDAILLSNKPDYFWHTWGANWEYARLRKYEDELEGLVKENGVIFLEYILGMYEEALYTAEELIYGSKVLIDDRQGEELYTICRKDYRPEIIDGIILKRVKK